MNLNDFCIDAVSLSDQKVETLDWVWNGMWWSTDRHFPHAHMLDFLWLTTTYTIKRLVKTNLMNTCRISLWSSAMLSSKCRPKCFWNLCLLTKNNYFFTIWDYFKGQRRCSEENWPSMFEHTLCLSPSQAESTAAAMCHMTCVKSRPSAARQQEDHTQGRTMKCHRGVAYWAMSTPLLVELCQQAAACTQPTLVW